MKRQGRVLVVDDLEKWRKILVQMLQRDGFYADAASTAAEALEHLGEAFYHVLVLDIRLVDADPSNKQGIDLLAELDKRGLGEATKVILLSAYGTKEQMRTAFRDYRVADFLAKDEFTNQEFLNTVQQAFSDINLALQIPWQPRNGPDQAVLNLKINGTLIRPGTALQNRIAEEFEDLLCRLFHRAKSVLVQQLTQGHSGAGVLRVKPFYTTGGGGHDIVVKFGDSGEIEREYHNFKEYVQPFLGGGRNTTLLDFRRTPRLGGIIYSLLGSINDRLVDFDDFYRHTTSVSQIKTALNRLFRNTCGPWYANPGNLDLYDLSTDYQRLLKKYTPEQLQHLVAEQLTSVQGKHKLHFKHLKGERSFTNPLLVMANLSPVRSTYLCITHGDFNYRNLLVDSSGQMWMIDFEKTGQSHILRDVATLDSVIRFQLLAAEEAALQERLQMEEALCSIEHFSQVKRLMAKFSTTNQPLAKAYATVVHLRTLACKLVAQNPNDDISEYSIALFYNALNALRFSSLSSGQREHALLSASLLADRLGLGN